MKTSITIPLALRNLLWSLAVGCLPIGAPAQSPRPAIAAVRVESTNVVVEATVPAGLRKITLECRTRLGRGSWEPRAVARLDGTGGRVIFRLPRRGDFEALRVRADERDPLPVSFYTGAHSFAGDASGGVGIDLAVPGGATPGPETARDVVESDIWRIRRDTLYFFNTYRGLQVIDIANADAPVLTGTLPLPAAGEDLYVLDSGHVVLLARNGCGGASGSESSVLTIAISQGAPSLAASRTLGGDVVESRMVGTALYVATQTYRPAAGTAGSTWEWGTLVSSFDLADPAAPVARGAIWFKGYGNVVSATDKFFFAAVRDPANWYSSIVHILDITSPDGTMREFGSVRTDGGVKDKFKLNHSGTTLTTIAEAWTNNRTVTRLETWRLPDPRAAGPLGIVKLGQVELGRGETLHATRFDGDRCYVVTFFRIDPLWIVDLSDPARPRITGELEVPGWSTYIQPLGDRLVAVGVETGRVAVSLFDVRDAARPALASKVLLGQNYSWSEANADEKAFTVLPDDGLILVPYSGDTTNGWTSQVQLIDLTRSNLVKRGLIEHPFQPRRATLHRDRVLSLSGWELLSVDASDRDHPLVRSTTTLAWPVDRVFVQGPHLLELATSGGWVAGRPTLRVASAARPEQVLTALALGDWPVVGATVRDARLYLAQGQSSGWSVEPPGTATNFSVTVFDLSQLPALPVLGRADARLDDWWGGEWEALWPSADALVWSGGGNNFWWGWDWLGGPLAGGAALASPGIAAPIFWPGWGGQGGRLLAFDVTDSAQPRFASEVNLTASNWWSFSKASTAGGLVQISHSAAEWFEEPAPAPGAVRVPPGTWLTRHFLDVVDFADVHAPTVRRPVNIPGSLTGVSHEGNILYTLGQHFDASGQTDWSTQYLDGLAYDGVAAHLVDSLALPNTWPRPLLVSGNHVFIGRSDGNSGVISPGQNSPVTAPTLETWTLADSGKFTRVGTVSLAGAAFALTTRQALLAVQQADATIALFDATTPATLRRAGQGHPGGCLWFDLEHADGDLARGLWLPLGSFGVAVIPSAP